MKLACALLLLGLSWQVSANALFKQANLTAGKKLVQTHCISCHASSFGGDGSEIYTRDFRKVTTPSALLTQVRNCSTMLDLKWFDEEELNAAAYLNKTYYKFE
ncbi:MAG TPA: cytochrome c [Methylophilus sp.]